MVLNLSDRNPARLLSGLREGLALNGGAVHLELVGPALMCHDTALMLYHELRSRPRVGHLHIHSHTCLFDGAVLLWLAGDSRTLRPDGWIQLSEIPCTPPTGRASRPGGVDYCEAIAASEERPADTDLRRIMDHLDEWLPVHEIAGLRLFPNELRDLGLLASEAEEKMLAGYFQTSLAVE